MISPWRAVAFLSVVAVMAACGSPAPSATPEEEAAPMLPRACLGLAEPECDKVLAAAVEFIRPSQPGQLVYAEVGPFGCAAGAERCENSLAARPEGRVLLEFAAAEPAEVSVRAAPDGSLELAQAEAFTVRLEPSSVAVGLAGPVPFELGHCGLGSGIDFDGSWWDPVGVVDSGHTDAINAASGSLAPTGARSATFTSDGGLVVTLLRRDGPKSLPLCM